ncbi:MAG: YIP1 family protein [Deferribacteres bacterium]|nr:YIP1 family protein [candidate division KSB1 bacterium]MCB9512222.1 YIP1 family protein [Deferribacteres bacterium]
MNEATQSPSDQGLSTISRIIGVITSPRPTFDDIVQRPTWLVPFVLVVALGVLNSYLLIDLIAKAQVEQMSQNPNVTEQQIEMTTNITKSYGWMFAIVTTPLFYVIVGAVLLFTGNVILGGESRFKVLFSVTCWSGVISIITSAITVPIMLSRGAIESPTSLAFLAPSDDKTSFLYSLLSSLDLLTIWYVAVMGIGVAAAYKFTNQKGITVTATWWIILIVVGAGWRAMFS